MPKFSRQILLAGLIALSSYPVETRAQSDSDSYAVIEDAVKAVSAIKVGDTRAKLEQNFREDGGIIWWNGTSKPSRYLYKKCILIKVDVEFALKKRSSPGSRSPNDTVTSISKPYLEYPHND